MTTFLFIIVPIICECVYIIYSRNDYGYYYDNYLLLIPFGIYLLSIFIAKITKEKLIKKKFLCTLLFIIFPLATIFVTTLFTTEWYENGYKKLKLTASVYLFDNNANEDIVYLSLKPSKINETFIDLYYDKFCDGYYYLDSFEFLSGRDCLSQNEVQKFKIRPGNYKVKIKIYNTQEKKYYYFESNEDLITTSSDKPVFLCYDGENLFTFEPNEKELESLNESMSAVGKKGNYRTKWFIKFVNVELQQNGKKTILE